MTREEALQIASGCWCTGKTKHLTMQPEVAEVFAMVLVDAVQHAQKEVRVIPEPQSGSPGDLAMGIARAIDALSPTLYRCSGETLIQARAQQQQLVDALVSMTK